jgi:hypothetical protein
LQCPDKNKVPRSHIDEHVITLDSKGSADLCCLLVYSSSAHIVYFFNISVTTPCGCERSMATCEGSSMQAYEYKGLHEQPDFKIETRAQAIQWMQSLIAELKMARAFCDVVHTDQQFSVRQQRKNERVWLMKHGAALGTLLCLHRCDRLDTVAYNDMRKEIMETMQPTIVGAVQS